MRNSVLWGLTALSAALFAFGHEALAIGETGTMRVHRDTGPTGYTGDIGGGEFGVYDFSNLSILAPLGPGVKATGMDFQTFCVENSNVPIPQDVDVNWIVNAQVNNVTPIAPGAAYLYTQFWNGALAGYNYTFGPARELSAHYLQEAIWFFQGQWQGSVEAGAQTFVTAANTAVAGSWGNTVGNVRALTTTDANGGPEQDVLVVVQAPAPPPPPPTCCGYKDITFQYCGKTDNVTICAVDPTKCGTWFPTSISWCRVHPCTTFTVSAGCSPCAKFPDSIKLIVKDRCGRTVECVTVNTSCNALTVGEVVGDFTVLGFHTATCCTTTKPPCTGDKEDEDDDENDDDQGGSGSCTKSGEHDD
jgi:hypothetical protein